MIPVTLYSRKDCHLCEQVRQDLAELEERFPHRLTVVDIDHDQKLREKFGLSIPAISVGPFTLKSPFTFNELEVTLAAATDRAQHISQVENSPTLQKIRELGGWRKSDQISMWFSRHYMLIFNLLVTIYLLGAFTAPILMKLGYVRPASLIYKGYSLVCHQLAYRSFFLFGEQQVYPRTASGVDNLLYYNEATGFGEGSSVAELLQARSFTGDPLVGYKIALCQRDLAIYGGILLFGLLFSLSSYRLPAIPWYLWAFLAIFPIGLDGFSQLLSQPPLSFLPYRESTPALRVLTGFLFGFGTAWFGYPVVEESMREMRLFYKSKWQRVHQIT